MALLGSGETSPAGRRMHDRLIARLPRPATVAILETPAGFQPNVDRVAGKIAEFLRHSLRNHDPRVLVVQARKRGTPFDPDDPQIAHFVLPADYIFAGPGSPSYAARQLNDSLTLSHMKSRHQEGATLSFASAAALAVGTWVIPVYEIYKSGEDLRWEPGLNLFEPFGLDVTVVTHWNNKEGGKDLDTSRCYMGQARFDRLCAMLPSGTTILGVDEQVACIMNLASGECEVSGPGGVTIIHGARQKEYRSGERFSIEELRNS
jgi:cyanophycinase-like exopeptidase